MSKNKVKIAPGRSYSCMSVWQTAGTTVEYESEEQKVSIFQGSTYLVYPVEEWFRLVQAVEEALPMPLDALVAKLRQERDEAAAS